MMNRIGIMSHPREVRLWLQSQTILLNNAEIIDQLHLLYIIIYIYIIIAFNYSLKSSICDPSRSQNHIKPPSVSGVLALVCWDGLEAIGLLSVVPVIYKTSNILGSKFTASLKSLVGGWALPLWKIWKSDGVTSPIYCGKIKNVPNHQTVTVSLKWSLSFRCLSCETANWPFRKQPKPWRPHLKVGPHEIHLNCPSAVSLFGSKHNTERLDSIWFSQERDAMIIELDDGNIYRKPDQFDGKNHGFWLRCSLKPSYTNQLIWMKIQTLLSREYKKDMGQRGKKRC